MTAQTPAEVEHDRGEADGATARWASSVVVLLSLTTGATDAITFIRLGSVFASVITGNMVLLGVAAGKHEAGLGAHAAVTLVAYVVGSALGAAICGKPRSITRWCARARRALGIELVLFVGIGVGWEVAAQHPHGALDLLLLAMASGAMGVQSTVSRSLPLQTPSTTYLTGTLTSAVSALTMGATFRDQHRRFAAVLGLVAGAGIAVVLVTEAPASAPFLAVVLVAAALVVAGRSRPSVLCR